MPFFHKQKSQSKTKQKNKTMFQSHQTTLLQFVLTTSLCLVKGMFDDYYCRLEEESCRVMADLLMEQLYREGVMLTFIYLFVSLSVAKNCDSYA